jgi:hypothetical protein
MLRAPLLVLACVGLVAVALNACGTVLAIEPDNALPGEAGGEGGSSGGDVEAGSVLDSSDILIDFDAGDASVACALNPDRTTLAMGDVPVGVSRMETIHLTSLLPTPTIVNVAVSGAGFSLVTPAMTTVMANATSDAITVAFSSALQGTFSGTLLLTWAGGCQVSVPLSATGVGSGTVAISPSTLDLGSVKCGGTPDGGAIEVDSQATYPWTASMTPSTPFGVAPSGSLLIGSTFIPVTATALLPKEDPKTFTAVLNLNINSGQVTRAITVQAVSLGGKLAFSPNAVLLSKASPSHTIALTNTGTQAVEVTLGIGPPFKILGSNGSTKVIVPKGGSQPVVVSTTGVTEAPVTQTATVTGSGGTLCFAGPLTVHQ